MRIRRALLWRSHGRQWENLNVGRSAYVCDGIGSTLVSPDNIGRYITAKQS